MQQVYSAAEAYEHMKKGTLVSDLYNIYFLSTTKGIDGLDMWVVHTYDKHGYKREPEKMELPSKWLVEMGDRHLYRYPEVLTASEAMNCLMNGDAIKCVETKDIFYTREMELFDGSNVAKVFKLDDYDWEEVEIVGKLDSFKLDDENTYEIYKKRER